MSKTIKEAVVFILDSSPSMNTPYPSSSSSRKNKEINDNNSSYIDGGSNMAPTTPIRSNACCSSGSSNSSSTRLSCAKSTIQYMISDLMIRSKANEVCVIVLKTLETRHHMVLNKKFETSNLEKIKTTKKNDYNNGEEEYDHGENDDEIEEEEEEDIPFPNITELYNGVRRPTIDLLWRVGQVQSSVLSESEAKTLRGDFCDGIIVAADALYQRTFGKTYERRIVIFTDAEHGVVVDINQLLIVIDALRSMECKLHVIGLDFSTSADFQQPASPGTSAKKSKSKLLISNHDYQRNVKNESKYKRVKVKLEQQLNEGEKEGENNDNVYKNIKYSDQDITEDVTGGESIVKDNEKSQIIQERHEKLKQESSDHITTTATCQENDYDIDINSSPIFEYSTKEDREKLLISLTEKTGGNVFAASSMLQILETNIGKKTPKSAKRKVQLRIAPTKELILDDVRYSLLQKKSGIPRLKKEAVLLDTTTNNTNNSLSHDDNGSSTSVPANSGNFKPLLNGLGQEITSKIAYHTTHWEYGTNNETEISPSDRTKAVRFGSDIIPMGKPDFDGLKRLHNDNNDGDNSIPHIQILGYMDHNKIPQTLLIGPPYAVYSDDSGTQKNGNQRTAAAISSLSQALYRLDRVAICTFVKSTGSDPILGGIFPLLRSSPHSPRGSLKQKQRPPNHLVFLQLPFAGDVKKFSMKPFDKHIYDSSSDNNSSNGNDGNEGDGHDSSCNNNKSSKKIESVSEKEKKCSDDLVRALMLPDDVLCNEKIPNPFLHSYRKTLVKRALEQQQNPSTSTSISNIIVSVRDEDDLMATPKEILNTAKPALESFRKTFPCTMKSNGDGDNDTINYNYSNKNSIAATKKKKRNQMTYRDFL